MDLAGAELCCDIQIRWILFELSQAQIDQCVEFQYDEHSGLRFITVDTRECKVVAEAG